MSTDWTAIGFELAAKAEDYARNIAECSCEDDPGAECWYRLSDEERAEHAFEYAMLAYNWSASLT